MIQDNSSIKADIQHLFSAYFQTIEFEEVDHVPS